MDFTKFVSMLENHGLFFAAADKLGDPFEGSISAANWQSRKDFLRAIKATDEFSEKHNKDKAEFYKRNRKSVLINSWHMNEYESAAMWKLYTQSNESIGVQSTFELLRRCLDGNIQIGEVEYIDFERDVIPESHALYPFMHKMKSFEHERELRALIWETGLQRVDEGVWARVDLQLLIQNIYVAPSSPTWFCELVSKLVKRYDLHFNVT